MTQGTRVILEDFASPAPTVAQTAPPALNDDDIARITEKAYQDGWDDCLQNSKDHDQRVSEALGLRLSEVTIATDDMRTRLIKDTNSFLAEILDKLLPQVAQTGFQSHLLQAISEALAHALPSELELCVCAEDLPSVQNLISNTPDFAGLRLTADPALGITQARLRHGDTAKTIDVLAMLDTLDMTFAAVTQTQKDVSNG